MSYPDKTIFESQVAAADAVVKSLGVASGLGTSLYEWVSRPLSYVFSALYTEFEKYRGTYTIQTLANSLATVNPTADAIMSNYFITRRQGEAATADLLIRSSSDTMTLPVGTLFTVSGTSLSLTKTFIITPNLDGVESSDTVEYLSATALADGTYVAVVQASSDTPASVTLPAGSEVSCSAYIESAISYSLASDLMSGADIETDAEMVVRAKSSLASPVGGLYTYTKKLAESGVSIRGCAVTGFMDPEMIRETYSGLLTGIGGCVDVWVKTAEHTQSIVTTITLSKQASGVYTGYLPTTYAGALTVSSVELSSGTLVDYRPVFGSSDAVIPEQAVRGSVFQTTMISATVAGTSDNTIQASVQIVYMPSMKDLQDYLSSVDVQVPGISAMVRSARPVYIGISGIVYGATKEETLAAFKAYIGTLGVGSGIFKVSDFLTFLQQTYPSAMLSSPVMIHVGYYTPNGVYRTEYSDNGIWSPREFPEYGFTRRVSCYMTRDDLNHFTEGIR